ncbi:MAG: iron complex transport system ATP-binding protein [Arenicella sp.]
MLAFKNIELKIGDRLLLKSDQVLLKSGMVALVGRNGAGKSTLLRSILGEKQMSSGHIELDGKLIADYKSKEIAKKIAVVFSKPQLFGDHSVLDVMLLGRIPHQNIWGGNSQSDIQIVKTIAKKISVDHLLDKQFQLLSDGEKQLVMIGRALAQSTDIILLDEPAAFLDVVNRSEVIKLLQIIVKTEQKLIIYSTHHVVNLEQECDYLLLLDDQRMKFVKDRSNFKNSIQKAFNIEL